MPRRQAFAFLVFTGCTRVLLAYLFLTASLGGWVWAHGSLQRVPGKMADPQALVIQLRDLGFAPDPWNAWIAMGLPWIEAVTGVALLLPWTALGALAVSAGLLSSFIALLVWAAQKGLTSACACFGGAGHAIESGGSPWPTILWRGLWLLMALASLILLWRDQRVKAALRCETSPPSSSPG